MHLPALKIKVKTTVKTHGKTSFQLFPIAALLLGLSVSAHASDLSLPTYAWAKNAALLNNPDLVNNPLSEFSVNTDIDVWSRIRHGFTMPDLLDNTLVLDQATRYAAHPAAIERTVQRASLYLYHVVQELEDRGMPTELALLPFVESAFNPEAVSSAKAAGMWQFIPSTGRHFNLKQNTFRDERLSVLASTDAALTYLQKLYDMFGDWQLALAAYNWGEGSVMRAIKKNQAEGLPTDFNSLSMRMPAETRNYVPKLQAIKNIIAAPYLYGITLPKVENQPYFVAVPRLRDIDVKLAAKLAELPMSEFKALNPQFNRPVIAGGSTTKILLPQSNAEKFKENMANWGKSFSSWTAHRITNARERIETIAEKFHTTPQILREANNIPPKMMLRAGSTILVPRSDDSAKDITQTVADNAILTFAPEQPPYKTVHVTIKRNDTLSSLARRYHVSIADLRDWNNMRHNTIVSGQKLEIRQSQRLASKSKKQRTQKQASKKTTTHIAANKSHHKKTVTAAAKTPQMVAAN